MTIHQAILYGENFLAASGIAQPRWDAERLLLYTLKEDRAKVYADLDRPLSAQQMAEYDHLLKKRAEHYPLAYIEGVQEFFGRTFFVNENVLIPRPETEEIIHAALHLPLPANPFVLDLGAGSGNIAQTLALEIEGAMVIALEISAPAIEVLRTNVQHRAQIVHGDFQSVPFLAESFDLITSNPPYVEESSFRDLPAETRWEPRIALASSDVQKTYDSLLQQATRLLRSDGYLIFEIGYGQHRKILEICTHFSVLSTLEVRKDAQGIPRTFVLQKRN